jgi:N-acetylglucosamine-6-phosphate deacetylase
MKTINALLYTDNFPVSIEMDNGLIAGIKRIDSLEDNSLYVAPGFIDIQINGYMSHDFSAPDLSVEKVQHVTENLWKTGVTTYFPTIITTSHERLLKNLAILTKVLKNEKVKLSVPGFHLEGPYISQVDGYRGAHNKKWVRTPDWEEFVQYYKTAENKIVQITLAPELDGAIELIEKCTNKGILVSLGHHNASTEIIRQAIDAGAILATHLGNGCANMIHRHKNPLWSQLADDRLHATIIADGHHLLPEELKVFFKVKGPEKLMLVSDMTGLAGMPPGDYIWDGKKVVMSSKGMIMLPKQDALAGAALPISIGIGNMMRHTQCSLADAIHMATRNQAKLFGLKDRGEIAIGKRADLVLFTLEDNTIAVKKTILAGEIVYACD